MFNKSNTLATSNKQNCVDLLDESSATYDTFVIRYCIEITNEERYTITKYIDDNIEKINLKPPLNLRISPITNDYHYFDCDYDLYFDDGINRSYDGGYGISKDPINLTNYEIVKLIGFDNIEKLKKICIELNIMYKPWMKITKNQPLFI